MLLNFKDGLSQLMVDMGVDANVRNFGNRWINEYDHLDLDDVFVFLDRIDTPFEVHPADSSLAKVECMAGILVFEDGCSLYQSHGGKLIQSKDDNQEVVSAELIKKAEVAIVVTGPPKEKPDPDWLSGRLERFKPILPKLLVLSFVANTFALSIPFITMAVYDHVIGGGARAELPGIAIGALLLFAMMLSMKVLRSQLLATIGNRVSREIAQAMLNRVLRTAPSGLKRTPTSSLLTKINLGNRLKSVVQGPLGGALLDVPFVLMFLIAIAVLGGWLVVVPIASIALYAFLARRSSLHMAKMPTNVTVGGATRQMLADELAHKVGYMKAINIIPNWAARFNRANTLSAKNSFQMSSHQARYTSAYYFLSIGSNLAVIALGIGLIFEGIMSPGGLIATMMLISRVTGPVNMLASSVERLKSAKHAKAQINQATTQRVEGSFSYQHVPLPGEAPAVSLDQVTIRYPNQMRPAVSGVSLDIEPGQLVAVSGPIGSGKTTLLEALAGLTPTQNGFVKVNGINVTQYDSLLYRHWLGYRGDQPEMTLTTIREFVKDGRQIDDDVIFQAIQKAGGGQWLNSLEDGLSTSLNDYEITSIIDKAIDFEGRILNHAKLLAHPFPLYILDTSTMNQQEKAGFIEFVENRRGGSTIVFTTHDKELIELSDQLIVLEQGAAVFAGPVPNEPEEVELNEEVEADTTIDPASEPPNE